MPEGFSYAGEGTKETGLVIKNDKDLNEFVWIPVKDMSYSYNRYALLPSQPSGGVDTATNSIKIKYASGSSYYYTEAMPVDEQTSVNTYGGYYIARYEAGILNKREKYTTPTVKPIFKKSMSTETVYAYNYVTRNEAKKLSEGLYNKETDNIKSKLCSSYAWDTALKFIQIKHADWITNSTGGNYGKGTGASGTIQPTGYHSIMNIYDMGGNVAEWTTEIYSYSNAQYVYHGGYYDNLSSKNPASYRHGKANSIPYDATTGFRVALYL